ncbi:MAG TPA: NmrA family NAD(P)-binding protein, partial [Mycobacterium sp.]
MTVLVTAANGNQGKVLIPKLLAAGVDVRACVRSKASASSLRVAGVTDIVVGDIGDPAVLGRAMNCVEKIYYVGPALHPQERETGFAVIDAARSVGVRHFVFSSVLHAITTDLIQHEIKRDLEENLLSSGLEFTILQPANYMLRHRLRSAFETGVFRLSWSLNRYQSMVDLTDVTDVAAAVLTDTARHAGATYELVAPGRYTAYDLARSISEVMDREIVAEYIDSDVFLRAALGTDDLSQFPYQTRVARAISDRYSRHDFVGNSNVLGWLLNRRPSTW